MHSYTNADNLIILLTVMDNAEFWKDTNASHADREVTSQYLCYRDHLFLNKDVSTIDNGTELNLQNKHIKAGPDGRCLPILLTQGPHAQNHCLFVLRVVFLFSSPKCITEDTPVKPSPSTPSAQSTSSFRCKCWRSRSGEALSWPKPQTHRQEQWPSQPMEGLL